MIALVLIDLVAALVLIKMHERIISLENEVAFHRVRLDRLDRK